MIICAILCGGCSSGEAHWRLRPSSPRFRGGASRSGHAGTWQWSPTPQRGTTQPQIPARVWINWGTTPPRFCIFILHYKLILAYLVILCLSSFCCCWNYCASEDQTSESQSKLFWKWVRMYKVGEKICEMRKTRQCKLITNAKKSTKKQQQERCGK